MTIRLFLLAPAVMVALAISSCGSDAGEAEVNEGSASAVSVQSDPPPTTAPPTTAPSEPEAPVLVPNVICMNLQDAQDLIQREGVFFSRSEDATGQGRNQILDSNWIVLAQEPTPGTPIDEFEAVLAVVKYGEPGSEVC